MNSSAENKDSNNSASTEAEKTDAQLPVKTDKKPAIFALFQRQRVIDPKHFECADIGRPLLIDVTDVVLSQPASQIVCVMDNHTSSDALVPYAKHLHNGVYRVEITESIKSHFGVGDLREIDQPMIDAALQSHIRMKSALSAKASLQKSVQPIHCAVHTRALTGTF